MDAIILLLLLILTGLGAYLYFTLKAEPVSTGSSSSVPLNFRGQIDELQKKLDRAQAATTKAETLAEERKNQIAKQDAELSKLRKRLNDCADEKLELSKEVVQLKTRLEDEQKVSAMVAELHRKIDDKF